MLIIETVVNYNRIKLRGYDYYRHNWFLDLGLFETAELVMEDHKKLITWFNKSRWKREWIDN